MPRKKRRVFSGVFISLGYFLTTNRLFQNQFAHNIRLITQCGNFSDDSPDRFPLFHNRTFPAITRRQLSFVLHIQHKGFGEVLLRSRCGILADVFVLPIFTIKDLFRAVTCPKRRLEYPATKKFATFLLSLYLDIEYYIIFSPFSDLRLKV